MLIDKDEAISLEVAKIMHPDNTPMFPVGTQVRHREGGIYTILISPNNCFSLEDVGWVPTYEYVGEDGRKLVQPATEMEDGRFVVDTQTKCPRLAEMIGKINECEDMEQLLKIVFKELSDE